MAWPKARSAQQRGEAEGYRSGLEDVIAEQIAKAGFKAEYEAFRIRYIIPERAAHYTPDWVFLHNGIVIEGKGRFVTSDRKKHTLIQEQYPDLDIRFVFSRPNDKIGKKSKTTYAMWCDRLGILWAHKRIPIEWLQEPPEKTRIAALKKFLISKQPKKEKA